MLNLDLNGKNALVAGSSQGIGLASAQALASLGANCFLIARNEHSLVKAIETLEKRGDRQHHSFVVADFSQPEEVKQKAEELASKNPIHILINNTGGPPAGPVIQAKAEQFLAAFEQHLICNQLLATSVLEGMKQAGYGRIINIVSTSVKVPLRNLGVSNTIRGAVASWAKSWANEVAAWGITVNNVLPGATATARLSSILDNKVSKAQISRATAEQEMLQEIPAKRFGLPEEIAALVAFLASPAAAYINGTSIPVDGGRTGAI